jgi:hypothetical protein
MSYIVRVVGYNAYWTGDTEPGKCWSTSILESQVFETEEEAEVIVNSGTNMEVVEYDFATSDLQKDIPDWDAIDEKVAEIEASKQGDQEFIQLNDFETVSEEVHDVNVEVLD